MAAAKLSNSDEGSYSLMPCLQIDECNLQTESSLQTNESLQTRSVDKILSADEARLQIDECNLQTKSSLQTKKSYLQTKSVCR